MERHLWTPQFAGNIGTQYANYGEIHELRSCNGDGRAGQRRQRLPLGGTVTARVIDNLMHNLTHHVTTGETGQAVLSANIPLLQGAGLVAYDLGSRPSTTWSTPFVFSKTSGELLVQIAGDYFNLQQLRQAIFNARDNTRSLRWLADYTRAHYRYKGDVVLLEVQRQQSVAFAENEEIDASESYRTALISSNSPSACRQTNRS